MTRLSAAPTTAPVETWSPSDEIAGGRLPGGHLGNDHITLMSYVLRLQKLFGTGRKATRSCSTSREGGRSVQRAKEGRERSVPDPRAGSGPPCSRTAERQVLRSPKRLQAPVDGHFTQPLRETAGLAPGRRARPPMAASPTIGPPRLSRQLPDESPEAGTRGRWATTAILRSRPGRCGSQGASARTPRTRDRWIRRQLAPPVLGTRLDVSGRRRGLRRPTTTRARQDGCTTTSGWCGEGGRRARRPGDLRCGYCRRTGPLDHQALVPWLWKKAPEASVLGPRWPVDPGPRRSGRGPGPPSWRTQVDTPLRRV